METPGPETQIGSTAGKIRKHRADKKDNKKGRLLRFYLLPEDDYLFTRAMQESGFSARSHLILTLLRERQSVIDWRRAQTKRILADLEACGLTIEDLQDEVARVQV